MCYMNRSDKLRLFTHHYLIALRRHTDELQCIRQAVLILLSRRGQTYLRLCGFEICRDNLRFRYLFYGYDTVYAMAIPTDSVPEARAEKFFFAATEAGIL